MQIINLLYLLWRLYLWARKCTHCLVLQSLTVNFLHQSSVCWQGSTQKTDKMNYHTIKAVCCEIHVHVWQTG